MRVRLLIGEPEPDAALRPHPVGGCSLGFSKGMPQRSPLPEIVFLRLNTGRSNEHHCVIPTQRVALRVERQSRSLALATGMAIDGLGRVHLCIVNGSLLIGETQSTPICMTSHPPCNGTYAPLVDRPYCRLWAGRSLLGIAAVI